MAWVIYFSDQPQKRDDRAIVKQFVEKYGLVDSVDPSTGQRPSEVAADYGYMELAKYLESLDP